MPRSSVRVPPSARLAAVLWVVFAFLVWNVVFDRTLVLAGRRYSYAAAVAARRGEVLLRIDDWMRPAIRHGLLVASASALAVAVCGLAAIALAIRKPAS